MTQNMFQEGLYQVFFREQPSPRPLAPPADRVELGEVRITRWFGTIVNTRLLISGVVQVFGALASILATVTHACLRFSCSVSMTTPVWAGLFYVATGGLTIEVQRRPNKLKVTTLMGLNIFSVLLAFCALLAYSFISIKPTALNTSQQRAGAYVAQASSIVFTVQCMLASIYTLFLTWRGLRRYSAPHSQTYSRLSQGPNEHTEALLEADEFSL
ncbi:transmembrane protein 253 [Aplochiton taeniatus]